MTVIVGLPVALLVGLVFGWGVRQVAAIAVFWYLTLASQTAYLAHVGQSAFGSRDGLDTVHSWVYWVVQPLILGAAWALAWAGSGLRRAVLRRISPRSGAPASVSADA